MISSTLKATTGLSPAVFRTTIIPRRSLTSLTMGFDEIAAWKARRLASLPASGTTITPTTISGTTIKATTISGTPIRNTTITPAAPLPPTTLHSSISIPTFPRRHHPDPEPHNPNERSASEIHDVPSLDILGRLHAGPRPAPVPTPAPAPAAPASSSDNKKPVVVIPKSTLASGLETLRRLSDLICRSKNGGGGGSSTSSGPSAVPAPAPPGVPLKGGVATTNNEDKEKPVYSERRFPRELPMFLGGGLY